MSQPEETKIEPKKETPSLKSLKAEIDELQKLADVTPSNPPEAKAELFNLIESRIDLIEKQIQAIANSCGLKNRLPKE